MLQYSLMDESSLEKALEFAQMLARQAGEVMRRNFTIGMKKEWKEDKTPLTVTDTTINSLVLNAVKDSYPDHSFVGEEESNIKESEYTWVCDPVDGTVPFSHGYPTFVFSLALTHNGESVLGVVFDPIGDRLLKAQKGKGAFLNNKPISVSNDMLDERAFVSLNCDKKLLGLREQLLAKGCYLPVLYSCVYAGMLVASGEFEGEIYEYDKPWDGAALKIIVEEAGGKVTDLLGNEQRYDRTINGLIVSNKVVHDDLVAAVRSLLG